MYHWHWQMRNLALEGRVTVFKALAMSKIVHLALITNIPTSTKKGLNKLLREFIWKNKNPKIKLLLYVIIMIMAACKMSIYCQK